MAPAGLGAHQDAPSLLLAPVIGDSAFRVFGGRTVTQQMADAYAGSPDRRAMLDWMGEQTWFRGYGEALLAREEEREMIPLCLDEGVGTIIWSPLARGRLARPWDDARSTARSQTDGSYADLLYAPEQESSNRAIVDAVGQIADAHGVSRAAIALAWLHRQPVVTAPLVGAGSVQQLDDAIVSLDVELTDDEVRALVAPYTPRYDWQGVSDEATLEAIRTRVPGMALA